MTEKRADTELAAADREMTDLEIAETEKPINPTALYAMYRGWFLKPGQTMGMHRHNPETRDTTFVKLMEGKR